MEKNLLMTRPKPDRSQDLKLKERRVAAYLRVSTEEQAENPEGSIKNQEERIKMVLALKNADTPFGTLQGAYCDAGRSGKDLNRPELQRLLKAIAAREIDMVMVSELSRLTRSIKDFSQMWEFMQAHGCGFLSLRENFDTSTAAGEMMLYSIANFAQFERRQTSERVSAGFISRAQRGLWNGGVLPLGYEPDPENRGSLRLIEEEAKVVRAAFQALLTQGSVSSAAKWLNQNGYTYRAPLRGGGGRARHRHFTFDSLFRLLSNPAYAGLRVVKAKGKKIETVPAVWPAMIDPETFARAQKVLEAGKKQKTGRESRYPYLLSTRIYCGECGTPLVGISAHGATTKVPYYGHSVQIKREQTLDEKSHRCNPFRVPGRKLEERVWKEVLSLIESPKHREPLFNAVQRLSESKPAQRQTEKLENELRAVEGKLANLAKRIADLPEGVPAHALYDEMKRLAENQARLKEEIHESRRRGDDQRLASAADFDRLLGKLRNQLTELLPETKRRIIQTLIHKVVVTKDGFELHFYSGVDQIKKGEVIASPSFLLGKKISGLSSFKDLNGGPCRT